MCVRRPEDLGFRSVVTTEEKVAFFSSEQISADTTYTKAAKKDHRQSSLFCPIIADVSISASYLRLSQYIDTIVIA